MSAAPASRYLAEFGAIRARAFAPAALKGGVPPVPARSPEEEREAEIEAARARGREEGRIAAFTESQLAVTAERQRSEAAMIDARARWSAEEGDRLAALFAGSIATLEADIAGSVARILKPFIAAERCRRSLDSLAETLAMLLGRGGAGIRVTGPEDLIAALRARIGESAAIEFRESDSSEVHVLCGPTQVETRLADWAVSLAEHDRG